MAADTAALLIVGFGLMASIYPVGFVAIVDLMQMPPMLYVAATLRLLLGTAFLSAAQGSRATLAVFFLGVVMVLGGIVTPFIGQGIARPILDAWLNGEAAIVRGWGVGVVVLGSFALWALQPRAIEVARP